MQAPTSAVEASSPGSNNLEAESDGPHWKKETCSVRTQSPPSSTYCSSPPFPNPRKIKTLISIPDLGNQPQIRCQEHSKVFEFITKTLFFFPVCLFVSLRYIKNIKGGGFSFFSLLELCDVVLVIFIYFLFFWIFLKILYDWDTQRHQASSGTQKYLRLRRLLVFHFPSLFFFFLLSDRLKILSGRISSQLD